MTTAGQSGQNSLHCRTHGALCREGVIAPFPRRRTLSLREFGRLRGAPFRGMVEVSNNPHASDQEPLYGAYYTDKGLVDNHLAAFSGTTLRRTRPWGSPD